MPDPREIVSGGEREREMYPSDEDVNDNYDFSSREKVHKLFNFAPRHALGLTRNEK